MNYLKTLPLVLLLVAIHAVASPCVGDSIVVPDASSLPAIEAKAEAGDAQAQVQTGLAYVRGRDIPRNLDKAITWLKRSASSGNSDGQYQLALYYGQFTKSDEDVHKAVLLLKQSAAQDCVPARFYLGAAMMKGIGTPKNIADGLRMIKQTANAGYQPAQVAFGSMLISGDEVKKDQKAGLAWLRKAALAGYSPAEIILAFAYLGGVGVPPNPKGALLLLHDVYMKGDGQSPKAAYLMGRIYMDGTGVDKNDVKAFVWMIRAAKFGVPHAWDNVQILLKRLPRRKQARTCDVYMVRDFKAGGAKRFAQTQPGEQLVLLEASDSAAMVYYPDRKLGGYVPKTCL